MDPENTAQSSKSFLASTEGTCLLPAPFNQHLLSILIPSGSADLRTIERPFQIGTATFFVPEQNEITIGRREPAFYASC